MRLRARSGVAPLQTCPERYFWALGDCSVDVFEAVRYASCQLSFVHLNLLQLCQRLIRNIQV